MGADPTCHQQTTGNSSTPVRRNSNQQRNNHARTFTQEEVAQHATEGDCYTIVEGKVYDVTKYLRLHPGGMKLLFKNAGGDSTADFLALRHSAKSRVILENYYVGELVTGQRSSLSATNLPPRPVGAMVGSQPFLAVAPTGSNGPHTPNANGSATHVYPPPRSNALHPSSSHPDRLTAYASFDKEKQSRGMPPSIPILAASTSSGLSINLLPPHSPPRPPPSTTLLLQRSPTSEALEHHLASHISPTSDSSDEQNRMQDVPPRLEALRLQVSHSTPPTVPRKRFFVPPPVPKFEESSSAAMDTSSSSGTAAASSASSSTVAASSTLATVTPASATTPSSFGPKLFALTRRTQKTHDVQLLDFEPIFPASKSAPSTPLVSSVNAASSATPSSTNLPSSLDPAFWLHIPCGMHISIGCTMQDGTYVKRPYTPVSNSGGKFELLVKRYELGVISSFLHSLSIGAVIDVYGPLGEFDYAASLSRYSHWIMISQGTGIAPMYQLIRHVRAEANNHKSHHDTPMDGTSGDIDRLQIDLLDCNRSEEDILLRDELSTLASESDGKFRLHHLLSKPTVASPTVRSGRLNESLLNEYLSSLPTSAATIDSDSTSSHASTSTLFLLCGSDTFHLDVTRLLLQLPRGPSSKDQIFCF